ncbi:hypothetical protein [Yersinia ruckeri]|uniref:hypothetical protein n=1 Tax=Yersinia ruckeri TaxID=29486 RepID=UPI002237E0AF|nr:hypothetical protein [Yersinia ruckeri]MCW6598684.1 hypothetical protein [Yersinia ruckeri]
MALILRAEEVSAFSVLSDVFDENRGEFARLAPSKSLMVSDSLQALVNALAEIRKEAPGFQLHFKSMFISPQDVDRDYKTRPRGQYCPHKDDSYSWLGSAFTIASEDYFFARYGTTKDKVVQALLGSGFVQEYSDNIQIHFRLDKPREYLYHKCYLA